MQIAVTSIRYYKTRNGVGYECNTNLDGVHIYNDGHGGATFLQGLGIVKRSGASEQELFRLNDENHLERLIDDFEEGVTFNLSKNKES